jgi:hypothetical protein
MPFDTAILEAKKDFYFFLAETIDFNYLIAYNINIKQSTVMYDCTSALPTTQVAGIFYLFLENLPTKNLCLRFIYFLPISFTMDILTFLILYAIIILR